MIDQTTSTKRVRNFLDISCLSRSELDAIFADARMCKKHRGGKSDNKIAGKTLVMIFEKHSTRTRLSFEIAMLEQNGYVLYLDHRSLHLHRGCETVEDTARTIGCLAHAIVARLHSPEDMMTIAKNSNIPTINGLTDLTHPCQILADIMTFNEIKGSLTDARIVWLGDGNNVANSWLEAAARYNFHLVVCCPPGYEPDSDILSRSLSEGANISLINDPYSAVTNADAVVTDAWLSMHHDASETEKRRDLFMPYRVTGELMAKAKGDAIFMHCLPAHRGAEVDAEVIDGARSVVWQQANNRLHVQKAILRWCLAD